MSVALLALLASSASAAVTRVPTGTSFGPGGTGAGEFAGVHGIAADPATGDVYVLDESGGGEIHKFTSGGEPVDFSALGSNVIEHVPVFSSQLNQIAVAPQDSVAGTAGDIYSASYGSGVSIFSPSGTQAGEFGPETACGVTTDPAGHIFVGDLEAGMVTEYEPTGDPLDPATEIGHTSVPIQFACGVAATGSAIYAAGSDQAAITRLSGITDPTPSVIEPGGNGVAIDPANENLNVAGSNGVVIYDSLSKRIGEFGNGAVNSYVSVSASGANAYAYDATTPRVDIYGPLAVQPDVATGRAQSVTETTAILTGTVNPDETEITECVFEYGPTSSYGFEVPCQPGPGEIGDGDQPVLVEATVGGLELFRSYHFRLSVTNSGTPTVRGLDEGFVTSGKAPTPFGSCPANEIFRVESSAALPDCRAYEQASPADKNGGGVAGEYPLMFAAEDGSAVTFYSPAASLPPGTTGGTQIYPTYLASRTETAGPWSSQRLLAPRSAGEESEFLGSSPDLRYAVVEAGTSKETGLFLIDTESRAVTQIVPVVPYGVSNRNNQFGLDGISSDGSRVFFDSTSTISTTPALPAPPASRDNLYMWEASTGDVSLVGVLPAAEGGGAPPAGSFGGAYEWYGGEQPSTGGPLNEFHGSYDPLAVAALHAFTPSGEQIFFTAARTGQLYLRRGLGGANPSTVHISTPNTGVVDPVGEVFGPYPGAFQEATPDGSEAFFLSHEKLTSDAGTGEEDEGTDLYRWDRATESLVDITPENGEFNGARVRGLVGASANGASGYFIAQGVLDAGAEAGGENLYRFEEKAAGGFGITFIATLAEGSETNIDRRNVSPKVHFNEDVSRSSRMSEDGNTLLFSSTKSLTGYDNFNLEGISCAAANGGCAELYIYSAQARKVTCLSCDPTGADPIGAASLQDTFFNAYLTPNEPPAIFPSRNLSADGTRVFFQTPDPLVPADGNGSIGCAASGGQPGHHNLAGPGHCQDVYEWEAAGSGSCKAVEANGGCLYLLSTGQSLQPSYFVGASRDGSSAFIATNSQLVPADRDQADDVYDVREGGGLASQHSQPAVSCGSAEACKGPGSASPKATSPATLSFEGPGNPTRKRCKRGSVAKKGKCVKKANKHHRNRAGKHGTKSKRDIHTTRSGGAK